MTNNVCLVNILNSGIIPDCYKVLRSPLYDNFNNSNFSDISIELKKICFNNLNLEFEIYFELDILN